MSTTVSIAKDRADDATLFLAKVFNWMAVGLAVTGVFAYLSLSFNLAMYLAIHSTLLICLCVIELGIVMFLSSRVSYLSAKMATFTFLVYAALNGLTLSTIFLRYTSSSITATFFITAGMFGAMALYGFVTKKDLSGLGSFCFMGLVGLIIAMIVNFFIGSSLLSFAISGIGVLIFVILTAYDVQRIKEAGEAGIMSQGSEAVQQGAIMGALTLYLDFINLFLMLLRFFGDSE